MSERPQPHLRYGPQPQLKNGPQLRIKILFTNFNILLRLPSGRQLQLGSPRLPPRLRIEIMYKIIKYFSKVWKEKIKCVWSSWGSWSDGIKTCDETTLVRRRDCECRGEYGASAESYEKKECHGKKLQARVKKLPSCYVPPPPEPATYEKPSTAEH